MVRYRKGLQFGALDKSDSIVFACIVVGDEDLVVKTQDGKLVHTPIEKIPLTDRTAKFKQFPLNPNIRVEKGWIHRRRRNN